MGRITTGLFLAISWLLLLFIGNYAAFCIVLTFGVGIALREFLRMSMPGSDAKYFLPVLAIGLLPLLGVSYAGANGLATGIFTAFFALILLTIAVFPNLENGMTFICRQWFGVFYVGFCSAHLILLRSLDGGINWLLVLTAITVCSDTSAYYAGRLLGKTKLYPALSPGKTRAGAVGGVLGGSVGGTVAAALVFQNIDIFMVGLLGLLLSVIGIIGDLIESLIKRVYGVKDSGQILPGHGGLLDRCDSIILTAPVLYYALYWMQAALFN